MGIFAKSLTEILLELLPNKGVDNGVEAAVHKGECLGQLHGQVKPLASLAVIDDMQAPHRVQKEHDIDGGPEQEEHNDNDKNQFHCFVFVLSMAPLQVSQNVVVAENEDAHREQPPHDVDFRITEDLPAITAARVERDAQCPVIIIHFLEEHKAWH